MCLNSLDPQDVCPGNIWNYRQNRPSLIMRDLEELGIAPEITEKILLARGVNKWLQARLDVIRLKDQLRKQITTTIEEIHIAKKERDFAKRHELRGKVKALTTTLSALRLICHSERFCPGDPE